MEIKNVHCEKQALELFRMMPDNKKSSLHNALSRNLEFTTSWGLELGELRAYQNGVYITLQGTRCSFSVYAELVNGKPVFKRKPPESILSPFLSAFPSTLEILPFWIIWLLLFINIPPVACGGIACSAS